MKNCAVSDVAVRAYEAHYVPDEMPFLIDDDGIYLHLINDFLRALPPRCASPNTWLAYARDLSALLSFLRETGRCDDLLRVGCADLRAFRDHEAARGIAPTSWNRTLAGLEAFFSWAHLRGRRADKPFEYVQGKGRSRHDRAPRFVNTLSERVSPADYVKCVTKREYQVFRDVGLRGLTEDGRTPDPSFAGHNGLRNGLIADWLVETGMRIEEAMSQMLAELPRDAMALHGGSIQMRLAASITKGRRSRIVRVPRAVLRRIEDYVAVDRADAVAAACASGLYLEDGRLLRVRAEGASACRVATDGRALRYDRMAPLQRRRLVYLDDCGTPGGPGPVFLTSLGSPLAPGSVDAIFARACARCAALGQTLHVTPHTLRHTFAVYMLAALMRTLLKQIGDLRRFAREASAAELQLVSFDPLRTLARMLGHRSVETTYAYLTYVVERQEEVEAESRVWFPDDRAAWDLARRPTGGARA